MDLVSREVSRMVVSDRLAGSWVYRVEIGACSQEYLPGVVVMSVCYRLAIRHTWTQ
jgi:hypothetical protein